MILQIKCREFPREAPKENKQHKAAVKDTKNEAQSEHFLISSLLGGAHCLAPQ